MAGTAPPNYPPVIFFAFAAETVPGHGELPRLADEQRQLRALLDPLVRAGRCELVERAALTPDDLFAVFQDERWRKRIAAFHFGGHADGYSLLVQNSGGQALLLGAGGLAEFLGERKSLQLVFLNACSTLAQAEGLHAAGVPAVIATSEDVDDDLALRFAVHFYRGLAGGASIGEAYGEAQGALRAEVYAKHETLDPGLWVLSADDAAKAWCWPPAARPRPDALLPLQKPLRTQRFTGRQEEMAKLLDDLQPGKVVTLCGPGGMGKSALAAEAIWTLAPGNAPPARFPDGILFHTFYHQPQASLALEKIARAYEVDPRQSPRDAALQALAGKTALLVLDGTEQADDLPAVLAVAGNCGVLVTTRRHTDAPDEVQDVAPLPRAESLALLRAWAGRYADDDDAANDIVRLLGGLPLALYLCGRYLAQRHQQAGEYVAWLKEEGLEALHFGERPTTSIPLLLARSLAALRTEAQAAFGVAGILALAPFGADAVAAALDIKPNAANRALGELVDYGLLLRPDDSYQVTHALAHSYARTQAAPDGEAVNRLALYYAALAEAESAKGLAGYAALDDQRVHIVAVQAAALKAEQWDAVRQITWKIEDYLDLQGYFTDRQTVIQAGLAAARASDAKYDEAEFLNRLGNAYADLGEPRRAIELYEQYLAIAREIGDRRGEGAALGSLGIAYADLGEPRRAIDLYEQRLVIARESGDRRGEGNALGNLGLAYADLGETRRAIDLYEQQLVIVREIGDRRGEGIALGNLGNAYAALGETRRAIDYHEQALVIDREIGDRRGEGADLGSLGNAYAALGETRRAIDLYEQQVVIVRAIGDRRGEGAALGNLGNAYADLGEPRRAIDLYEQRLVIAREIGDRRGEGNALGNLGNAYAALGEPRRAIDLYEQQLVIVRAIGDRRGEGADLGNLGNAYAALGETRRAIDYHEQALVIDREIGDRRGEGADLGNLGNAYAALGEIRRAIDYHEQALVINREISDRRGEGADLGNLGNAYAALGETRRAIDYHEQALVIDREIGDRRSEGADLGNLAESLTALGRHQDAVKAFAESIALAQADSYRYGEGVRRTNYAALLVLTGDIIQAQHEAAAAAGIAVETDNAQIGSESNTLLALIWLLTSDLTRAGAALAAAGRYSYPPTAAEQQFLAGVLALRSDNSIAARNAFAGAIGAADTRLKAEQGLYANLDGRALARCGLALSQPQGQAGSALVQAAADLRAACAINSDPGTLAQLRLRFGLLAPHDPTQQLAAVTAILDEAEAQER